VRIAAVRAASSHRRQSVAKAAGVIAPPSGVVAVVAGAEALAVVAEVAVAEVVAAADGRGRLVF
jgi:hypothetical protein